MITTKRLIIRPFHKDDLDDFYEYAKVPGVGEMAGWPHHKDKKESKRILKLFLEDDFVFAIVLRKTQKVIGSIGLHNKPFDEYDAHYKQKELGYVLSKTYWGQGLMSEAAEALIAYAFETWHLDRITCAHFTFNQGSKRIIEKMGFSYVRDDKYYSKSLDKTFDEKKYVLYHPKFNADPR